MDMLKTLALAEQDQPQQLDTSVMKDYGSIWDRPNYSCAFDSMFMVVFTMYRYAGLPWRQEWSGSSDFNTMTASFFDRILTATKTPLIRSRLPSLFGMYRDRVCDHFNAINPTDFPRFGLNIIAVSDIFVQMCCLEGDPYLAHLESSCNDPSHQSLIKGYNLAFIFLLHKLSMAERGSSGNHPTLQLWISSYLHKLKTKRRLCQMCRTHLSSSLTFTPLSWIWVDVPPAFTEPFAPSIALTFKQDSGPNIGYTLNGIIYAGQSHFSARWRDVSGAWWTYDGMVNSGRPSPENITDVIQLTLGARGPRNQ